MTSKTFATLAATLFAIIGVLQILRGIYGLDIVVAGVHVPVWASWLLAICAFGLSFSGYIASHIDLPSELLHQGLPKRRPSTGFDSVKND